MDFLKSLTKDELIEIIHSLEAEVLLEKGRAENARDARWDYAEKNRRLIDKIDAIKVLGFELIGIPD